MWLPPATLLIDAGYLLILGAIFGLGAVVTPSGRIAGRSWAGALAALALFGLGLPLLFYAKWPAWMWAYYVADPATVPRWIVAMLFALYVPIFLAAFLAACELRRVNRLLGWAVLALGVVVQVALVAFTWERYRRTGAFAGAAGPSDGWMTATSVALVVGVGALWWLARRRPESS